MRPPMKSVTAGSLSPAQARVLAPVIDGRRVCDLGAGAFVLTADLIALGARRVDCVDKSLPRQVPARVQAAAARAGCALGLHEQRFADLGPDVTASANVALLSWPVNWRLAGLVERLLTVPVVVYLGKNTDGTACGGPDLWTHLAQRPVLAYVPERANVLTVYGPRPQADAAAASAAAGGRQAPGDELAAMVSLGLRSAPPGTARDGLLAFDEAEAAAAAAAGRR